MIYLVIVAVLGFAAWQLISFVKKARRGSCASGCGSCGQNGSCNIQEIRFPQPEQK